MKSLTPSYKNNREGRLEILKIAIYIAIKLSRSLWCVPLLHKQLRVANLSHSRSACLPSVTYAAMQLFEFFSRGRATRLAKTSKVSTRRMVRCQRVQRHAQHFMSLLREMA